MTINDLISLLAELPASAEVELSGRILWAEKSPGTLTGIPLPVPSVDEQAEIRAINASYERTKQATIDGLTVLNNKMLAFIRGIVNPNMPHFVKFRPGEPAATLFAAIQQEATELLRELGAEEPLVEARKKREFCPHCSGIIAGENVAEDVKIRGNYYRPNTRVELVSIGYRNVRKSRTILIDYICELIFVEGVYYRQVSAGVFEEVALSTFIADYNRRAKN